MSEKQNPVVAIHTLRNTSPEDIAHFLDDGRLIKDLNDLGQDVVITDFDTFDNGVAQIPHLDQDGAIVLTKTSIDPKSIGAMRVRPLGPVTHPKSVDIPKLNSNSLKQFASSKIELYRQVLSDYQVPTEFLSMEKGSFDMMADIIHGVIGDEVVMKSNSGNGGFSTKILSKADALRWVAEELEKDNPKPQVVQEKVAFGPLPEGISAIGTDQGIDLVKFARQEALLSEVRMCVLKRGDITEVVPALRVVFNKTLSMQGNNDRYVDITLDDDLNTALTDAALDIVDKATQAVGGEKYVIGAIDFYFDEFGLPHVMDANLRSPGLPSTHTSPSNGRTAHKALAATLAAMAGEHREQA